MRSLKSSLAALPFIAVAALAQAQSADARHGDTYNPTPAPLAAPTSGADNVYGQATRTTTTNRTTTYDATGMEAPVTTTSGNTRTSTAVVADPGAVADGQDYVPSSTGLERQSDGGVAYATGGVSDEERAQLKSLSGKYNTQILSTAASGAYLGDYTVTVTDRKGGTVFTAPGDGPFLYVNLPAGTYDVAVTRASNSDTKKQKLTVGGKGHKSLKFAFAGE